MNAECDFERARYKKPIQVNIFFPLDCDSVVIDHLQCLREFEMIKFVSQMALSVVQELSTATLRAHGCR